MCGCAPAGGVGGARSGADRRRNPLVLAGMRSVDAPLAPGAPRPFGPLLKVLLLTGQRRNEVAGMTRDELSDDGATWNIPGSRTKNGRRTRRAAPAAGARVDRERKGEARQSRFHDNRHDAGVGLEPMKGRLDAAMLAAAREEGRAIIPPWTLHDLRRTFVTGMVELTCRRTSSNSPSILAARVAASPAPTTAAS